ncbi:MAG TPA: hypothetical protein VI039_12675 [Solirubrobacterales bacterium]
MTPLEIKQSVEDLIAAAVEAGDDRPTEDIAAEIAQTLDEPTLRTLAEESLIRTVQRFLRASQPRVGGGEKALGVPRSTRWEMVGRSQADGSLDLARLEVSTGSEIKPLLDCMYADLSDASENHLRFAMANEVFAEQYRNLAEMLLEDDNARTVRDLPEQQVREVLSA